MLGFPRTHWLEPMFWAQKVVHDSDREDAVSYCLMATKKLRDHMFEYRALSSEGQLVWLRDYVKVVQDEHGRPARLRGAMFNITEEKTGIADAVPQQQPTREELIAFGG